MILKIRNIVEIDGHRRQWLKSAGIAANSARVEPNLRHAALKIKETIDFASAATIATAHKA
jgi:hypothetical protein